MNKLKKEIENKFEYVGKKFPNEARKIHYGEVADKPIYGDATESEVTDLLDEGIDLVKLPKSFNKKKKISFQLLIYSLMTENLKN